MLRNIERGVEGHRRPVAYVHIPDMEAEGLNEFVKRYYPQLNKEALIVDVRGNAGGNVSPQIVERLRREMAFIVLPRNAAARIDPPGMFLGPKIMLLDEFSGSDGDLVAYRFQKHKLGPVIGKRSWGGVVGIRRFAPAYRRRHAQPAGVLALRRRRQAMDHRGRGRGARHRGRQRSCAGVQRHRRPGSSGGSRSSRNFSPSIPCGFRTRRRSRIGASERVGHL